MKTNRSVAQYLLAILASLSVTGIASAFAAGSQTITGSYWWIDGETTTRRVNDEIIPPSDVVSAQRKTCTFIAQPDEGLRVHHWTQWKRSGGLDSPSSFVELSAFGDSNPLLWEFDEVYGNPVTLGLVTTWIKYKLSYQGGSTTEELFTNRITIAESAAARTGYTFANAWTNENGQTFASGVSTNGYAFGIANHDDNATVNLYPTWTANQYTVSLDAQGGEGGTTEITATYDAKLPTIVVPSRQGYTFNGFWTTQANSGTQYYDANGIGVGEWKETNVATLYARWTVKSYTVTASADGNGTVSLSPTGGIYTNGQPIVLTATPKDGGSHFVGWSDGNAENPRTFIVTASTNFVANFAVQTFTVVFKGYYGDILKEETVEWGKDATPPDYPKLEGYSFSGWQPEGGYKEVKQNREVKATCTANRYQVMFYANDGTGASLAQNNFVYDQEQALDRNSFKRVGYTFVGWADTADGEKRYDDGQPVKNLVTTGTKALYAVWEPNRYTVVYNANGGEGEMADQSFTYDVPQNLASNAFTNGILEFRYWRCSNGTNYLDGALVTNLTAVVDGVVTNFAVWSENYCVVFDGNGATDGAMEPQVFVGPDDEQNLSSNQYLRVGYIFQGWATSKEGAVEFVDGEKVKGLASAGQTRILYAAWKPITYYVAFDPNGGSGAAMPVKPCVYDQAFELPDCTYQAPDPDLQAFAGWRDGASGKTYQPNVPVSNLWAVADGTNTLKATWKLDVGEWSEHMHCTTLRWDVNDQGGEGMPIWERMEGLEWGCTNTGSCVRQAGGGNYQKAVWLEASVKANGTLTFACKWAKASTGDSMTLAVAFASDKNQFFDKQSYGDPTMVVIETADEWRSVTLPVALAEEQKKVFVHIVNLLGEVGDSVCIDQMKWVPEGGEPEPPVPTPEDAAEISSATVSDGKFTLSFKSDEKFDYNLLTNANLQIDGWGVRETKSGDGEALVFEPPIQPGVPQMFYKVETIQKRK